MTDRNIFEWAIYLQFFLSFSLFFSFSLCFSLLVYSFFSQHVAFLPLFFFFSFLFSFRSFFSCLARLRSVAFCFRFSLRPFLRSSILARNHAMVGMPGLRHQIWICNIGWYNYTYTYTRGNKINNNEERTKKMDLRKLYPSHFIRKGCESFVCER